MKNRSINLFSWLLFLLPIHLLAQELPQVIPPSPEAASLGKFLEVPVSQYTGVPNISIPVTSFNVGSKTFPVSLNYHARGIQVSETASRVGLGWALNAGGQISRQVRHKADDVGSMDASGYFGYFGPIYSNVFDPSNADNIVSSLGNCCTPSDYDQDKLPDMFSLQAGELSTKFIFNYKDMKPLVQKYDDIIIDGGPDLGGFTVKDKEGYTYLFGGLETNIDYTQQSFVFKSDGSYNLSTPESLPIKNTWHLTRITSPNGDTARLFYNKETNYIFRRSYDEYFYASDVLHPDNGPEESDYHNYTSLVRVEQFQLSEIRYNYDNDGDYTKIVFESEDSTREDMWSGVSEMPDDYTNNPNNTTDAWPSDAKALAAIKIYEQSHTYIGDGGSPFKEIRLDRTFNLNHSYMISEDHIFPHNYHTTLAGMNPSAGKRLVLDSITEVAAGVEKPPYQFFYNPELLPNRHSNSQDYWGYYNGKSNGQFLCGYENNRRVDLALSEAGMLKKITYPTGGSTRFTYEHNRGSVGSEFENIFLPDINPDSGGSIGLSNIGSHTPGGIYNGFLYKTEPFQVTNPSLFRLGSAFNLPVLDANTDNPLNQQELCVGSDGGPYAGCQFSIQLVRFNTELPDAEDTRIFIWADSTPFWVDPGTYQLEVHTPVGWDPLSQADDDDGGTFFNTPLLWEDQVENQETILYASGKRIKQIEFLDEDDNVVTKKTYDYNNSGIILGISNFTYAANTDFGGGAAEVSADVNAATPGSLFSTYQGNTIGYRFVDEYYGDKDSNHGKRSYSFLVPKDTGDFIARPPTPPTDNEWLRGLTKQIVDYKRHEDGSYTKVKQIDNTYLIANDIHTNVLPILVMESGGALNPILTPESIFYDSNDGPSELTNVAYQKTSTHFSLPFVWNYLEQNIDLIFGQTYTPYSTRQKIFHFTGGTLDLSERIETLFDENGISTITTTQKNEYNYGNHYQPAKVTSVTSDGTPLVESFTYAQDLLSETYDDSINVEPINDEPANPIPVTEMDYLHYQHRIVPIDVITFKDENNDGTADDSELLSKSHTEFNWYDEILEPGRIFTSKGNDPLEERIKFHDYDKKGNPLEVSKSDGTHIIYVWGYNGTQPIAKIDNASYNSLSEELKDAITLAEKASDDDNDSCINASCKEQLLRVALNSLRNHPELSNSMVSTYTYDPQIGVTSMTDPRGYTMYYEYDSYNRLKLVKDQDRNILSKNDYNYGSQN